MWSLLCSNDPNTHSVDVMWIMAESLMFKWLSSYLVLGAYNLLLCLKLQGPDWEYCTNKPSWAKPDIEQGIEPEDWTDDGMNLYLPVAFLKIQIPPILFSVPFLSLVLV